MLKGLGLKYPFLLMVAIIFIAVVGKFIQNIFMRAEVPEIEGEIDVRYACSVYNNTSIGYDELVPILYGFKTEQCNNFVARLEENISLDKVERILGKDAVRLDECKLPITNTGSLYVVVGGDELDGGIILRRREVENGDLIVCEF